MRRQILLRPDTPILRLGGRLPRAIVVLLAVQIGLFVLYAFADAPAFVVTHLHLSSARIFSHGELWQPLTALWFHGGTRSLLLNALCLWVLGAPLLRWWGTRYFLFFWLLTGLAGLTLAALVGFLWPQVTVAGSGGASMALLVAAATRFPQHLVFFYGILPLSCRWLCALLGGSVLLGGLLGQAYLDLAVALGGAAMGYLLLPSRRGRADKALGPRSSRKGLTVVEGGKAKEPRYLN